MSSKADSMSLADAARAVGGLLGQGAQLGMSLLGSVKLPGRSAGCGCEIPPPCWEPQPIGDVTTRVCPGNQAVVTVNVTNCGSSPRTIQVESANKEVVVQPSSLPLGPYEAGSAVLSLDIPPTTPEGGKRTFLVWVRGCREHYLRWTVEVVCKNTNCCTDVDVDDCPDLVHHWYDHFYCERACFHRR